MPHGNFGTGNATTPMPKVISESLSGKLKKDIQ
jgi:hypothetical protein